MIEIIKDELGVIAKHFDDATHITLTFAVDKRTSRKFNPEEMKDMLSIYPTGFLVGVSRSMACFDDLLEFNNHTIDLSDRMPDIRFQNEDGESQDFELEAMFSNDTIRFFNEEARELCSLTLCIDELYLQTIKDKLDVGALVKEDLLKKVSEDLIPFILDYMIVLSRQYKPLKAILSNIMANSKAHLILNGTYTSMDYTLVKERFLEDPRNIETTPIKNDIFLRRCMITLIMLEIFNELTRGENEILTRFESTIRFLICKIIDGSKLNKFFGIEQIIRNLFLSSNKKGSMFDRVINSIMNDARGVIMDSYNVNNVIELFRFSDYKMSEERAHTAVLASKYLLQYAESIDIMQAVSSIPKEDIRLYVEGFFASDDDLDYELNVVNDMARKAAICKIDLEYITTKYSKKDALNNAYMCLADIRDARKKMKFKQAIEMIDAVADALRKDIKEAQSTDHKRSRMTVNINYPDGYKG